MGAGMAQRTESISASSATPLTAPSTPGMPIPVTPAFASRSAGRMVPSSIVVVVEGC